jgi:L-amino acid N-acyltransferase YncA
MTMRVRAADEADLPAIVAIYNDAVLNTTAIWNDTMTDVAGRRPWFRERLSRNYPVLVADDGGAVVGYASFGDFRPFEGFRISVEHSVYVADGARGRGVGRALVEALMPPARALGKRVMIGGIDASNVASLALHAKLGFVETARMPGIGTKFGRRLDLMFMQKEL